MGEIDFLRTVSNKGIKPSKSRGASLDYTRPEPEKKPQPEIKVPKIREDEKLSWWQKRKIKKTQKKKEKAEEKKYKQEERERKKKRAQEKLPTEKIVEDDIELLDPEIKAKQEALTKGPIFSVPEAPLPPQPRAEPKLDPEPLPQPQPAPIVAPEFLTPPPPPPPPFVIEKKKKHKTHRQVQNQKKISAREVAKIKNGEISLSSIDVNLLPKRLAKKIIPANRWRSLAATTLAILILIGFAYGGMLGGQFYLLQRTEDVQEQIKGVEKEIESYAAVQTEVNDLDTRVEGVKWLLNNHIYWTAFFAELEKYTLPEVSYTSFSGDVQGVFALQARTTDYQSVTQQAAVFKKAPFVKEAKVDAASTSITGEEGSEEKEVVFALTLEIDPEVFYEAR